MSDQHNTIVESPGLIAWQGRLLPLMSLLLIGLTTFFLVASVFQLYGLKRSIESVSQPQISEEIESLRPTPSDDQYVAMEKTKLALLVELEANALDRRYHQANLLILGRVWTIYLGFLTGMILSLVGAAFILGKLREATSAVDLSATGVKAAVQSASPGIILAFLGTVLMIVTVIARVDVRVADRPLYLSDVGVITSSGENRGPDEITVESTPTPTPPDNGNKNLDEAARKLGMKPTPPKTTP